MDGSSNSSLNLKIVKKIDSAAKSIVFLGRHVVVYCFENNSWVLKARFLSTGGSRTKRDILTMVLARRPEQNVILILNRQKTQNFILPFDEIKNCQVENGFLMISRTDGLVYGFWFFSPQENQAFLSILEGLSEGDTTAPNESKIVSLLRAAVGGSGEACFNDLSAGIISELFSHIEESRSSNYAHFSKDLLSVLQVAVALYPTHL